MNELEKIAARLEAALKKAGYYGDCFFRKTGKACPQCDEFDAILRDLRGIKVVLPQEIVDSISNAVQLEVWKNVRGEFGVMLRDTRRRDQNLFSDCAREVKSAIAALAEKIIKENIQ